MNCGHRIAQLRRARHLTQEEFSSKLGITRAALSHYENNRREPDYETIEAIAEYFQVSIDYILGRTNDPHSKLDPSIQLFQESLELADEQILEQFDLTIDGRKLTVEEAKRFIAFIRAERSMND